MSHAEEDWATWNFMQWFVQEQVEEETKGPLGTIKGRQKTNELFFNKENTEDEMLSSLVGSEMCIRKRE